MVLYIDYLDHCMIVSVHVCMISFCLIFLIVYEAILIKF
jgi:hypothetical protein